MSVGKVGFKNRSKLKLGVFVSSRQRKRHAQLVLLLFISVFPMESSSLTAQIEYKILSSQEDMPFLKNGIPPSGDEYRNAVKSWPDVRACLIESQRRKKHPDLRKIDWDQFYTIEDADVCLFRIFSSIGSMSGTVEWLEYHGFDIDGPRASKINMMYMGKKVGAKYVNGNFSFKHCHVAKFPTWYLNSIWINLIVHSQTISVYWTYDDKLIGVQNSYVIK